MRIKKSNWNYIECVLIGFIIYVSYCLCNTNYEISFEGNPLFLVNGYGIEHSMTVFVIGLAAYFVLNNPMIVSFRNRRKEQSFIVAISLLFAFFQVGGSNMAYYDSLMVEHGFIGKTVFFSA